MRRVLVVGSGGAGQSTLAARVGERTGLPVVHRDALYWHPGWTPTAPEAWRAAVAALVAADAWVMDGNYGGTLDIRLRACDTVVFLDLPRLVCLARVIGRWARYRGRSRPDMAPGCPERLTWEFLRWVWEYPSRRRPALLQRLAACDREVVVLRSRRAVARFVATLGRGAPVGTATPSPAGSGGGLPPGR
jgi:adenylate kinase family enzyme